MEPSYKPSLSSEELHDTVQETAASFIRITFSSGASQATEEAGGKVLLWATPPPSTCSWWGGGGGSPGRSTSFHVHRAERCRCSVAAEEVVGRMSCSVGGAPPPELQDGRGRVIPRLRVRCP